MRNTALYDKLIEIMNNFISDNFNILQINNISGKVLSLPENFREGVLSFFKGEDTGIPISFNSEESFKQPINIFNIETKQKILFNDSQTEKLFLALKEQAKNRGFVESFFNRKLQLKIEKMIKKHNFDFVEMELIKEDTEENNLFLNITVYNEDNFDKEDMSPKEEEFFKKNNMVEISLNIIKERLNQSIDSLMKYFEDMCLMLNNIDFNKHIINNEIGYIDSNGNEIVAGYVIKRKDKTDVVLFNNLLQQFEYEMSVLNRNRVLEKVAKIEVTEKRNDVASKFIETGFFTQQEYSKMYYCILNENTIS